MVRIGLLYGVLCDYYCDNYHCATDKKLYPKENYRKDIGTPDRCYQFCFYQTHACFDYIFSRVWLGFTLIAYNTYLCPFVTGRCCASTLILGFASQQLFSNLFSGLFLVINRPFKIGDTIEFQGSQGKVAEINLNATLIIDQDGNKIFIPSSIILNDKIKIVNIN